MSIDPPPAPTPLGAPGCRPGALGPPYDIAVPDSGYAWWYVDGISDDGQLGVTVIAFVGTVFSTRYALARRARGLVDPLDYCALNVVVYQPGGKQWAFTEWPRAAVRRHPGRLDIGPNTIGWQGDELSVHFDERTAPFGGRLRGSLRLRPSLRFAAPFHLDQARRHRWCPVAPLAQVEVVLDEPRLRFEGSGYHDTNWGDEPLEAAFDSWSWSRAELREGTAVLYDVDRRAGGALALGRLFCRDGTIAELEAPARCQLPRGSWGEPRATRTDAGGAAEVLRTLESSPFYARSLIRTRLRGETVLAMHEALSLSRFAQSWVQLLLPFRMRSRRRWPW